MTRLFDPPSPPQFHLSEDALTRAVCQELSRAQELLSIQHLNRCHKCLCRFDLLARTTLEIAEHHRRVMQELKPLPPVWRDRFIQQLDLLLESVPARSWWKPLQVQWGVRPSGKYATSLKGMLVAIGASLILFSVWHRHRIAPAAESLGRTVASDQSPATTDGSGVIHRRSRVETETNVEEHDAYRAISGHREPGLDNADAKSNDPATRLAIAGVNWDDSVSAASFKSWHNWHSNSIDDVYATGEKLFTMSLRLPSTNVAQGSLMPREDGFHLIERNIDYHELGTVEISEVGSEFPSWGQPKQPLFVPEPAINPNAPRIPARPILPSMTQVNETELEARLTLNQKSADTGEQIEIKRDAKGVSVQGLVESEERKKELNDSLQAIPFLSVTIKSFDDLESNDHPAERVQPAQQKFVVAQLSPLEQYFVQQGRSREDLTRISAGLFNCSLAINRSSRSIEQLERRFSTDKDLSPVGIHARDDLLSRVVQRLLTDLNEQRQFLDEANLDFKWAPIDSRNSHADSVELARLAELNNEVTRELISGAGRSPRPQKILAADLAETILRMRTAALSIVPGLSSK
jgi:hypothetical protein